MATPGTPVFKQSASGTTTCTTASFTPGDGDLVVYWAAARKNSTSPTNFSFTVSTGQSGTLITGTTKNFAADPDVRYNLRCFRAATPAVALTIQVTSSDAAEIALAAICIPSCELSATWNVIDDSSNTAGDPSMTLSPSPASTSIAVAFIYAAGTAAFSSPAGYTEILDATLGTAQRMLVAYDITSPAAGAAFTSTNTNTIGVLCEFVHDVTAKAGTDTGAFSASEAKTLVSGLSRTDSGVFSATEAKALKAMWSRTDTGAFSATEAKTILSALSRTDAGAFSATEAKTILSALSRTDSGAFSVTEAAAIVNALSRTDTGAFSVSEILTIVSSLSRTDAGAFSATEAKSLLAQLSRTDAGAFSATEAKSLLVLLSRVDAGALTASEAKTLAILTFIATSDAGALSAAEAAALLVGNPHTDSGAFGVLESASVAVVNHRSDSGAFSAGESATLVKTDAPGDGFILGHRIDLWQRLGL